MAGKTGTASIAINGHYSDSAYVASFIGMVPTRDPQLLVAVMVDQPQGSIYGGSVAAPAFQKIVGWAVPTWGSRPASRLHTGGGERRLSTCAGHPLACQKRSSSGRT